MIRIARYQHVGDHRLGRNATLDQPRRRWHLHHRTGAAPADQFGPSRHDHPELCGDHVQPFGAVLPDHRHRGLAAWAGGILGRQRHFDARQVCRQRAATGAAPGHAVLAQVGIALLRLGLAAGNRLFQRLQAELQLLLRQTFGFGAELHAFELQQQVANALVLLSQGVAFVDCRFQFGHQRQNQSAQAFDIVGQVLQGAARGVHHPRILRDRNGFVNRLCGLNTRPIKAVEQSCKLYRRKLHHPIYDRRPAERPLA